MKKFLLSIGLIAVIFTSCTKKDDQNKIPYLGQWDLVYFTKAGQTEIYIPGDIVWKFNKSNNLIVTIDTTLSANSQLPIKTTGTYHYTGAQFAISINNVQYAAEIMQDTLRLSHNPNTGGPLLKFFKAGE